MQKQEYVIPQDIAELLRQYAQQYETEAFLDGDPSWFMHHVSGQANQEIMAFLAAGLSYGSRQQFILKIRQIYEWAEQEPYKWVLNNEYENYFCKTDTRCFYRLYRFNDMWIFLHRLNQLLREYGSLGDYISSFKSRNAFDAISNMCRYFAASNTIIIPKDTQSACKRLCMFMRWLVRDNSPVDIGLWTDMIDKRSLIMPLDTHVLTEATELGLINSRTASMHAAQRLTSTLSQVFPDDPTRADFALFGYGVNKSNKV